MRLALSTSFAAGLAAAFLSMTSASATVPSFEQLGLPAPTKVAPEGVHVASVCGNWQPNAYNQSETCLGLWTGSDPDWVRQGDGGSQDRSFDVPHNVSSNQGNEVEDTEEDTDEGDEDQEPPCFC